MVKKYPELKMATSSENLVKDSNSILSLIGVEGGHLIGNSTHVLRMFYQLGARYLTLSHYCNSPFAEASEDSTKNMIYPNISGLTRWGKDIVKEMNRIGMMVDISHTSVQTMMDVLDVSISPVIFSHSNAYAIVNHTRNVPDNVLLRLKKKWWYNHG